MLAKAIHTYQLFSLEGLYEKVERNHYSLPTSVWTESGSRIAVDTYSPDFN